MKKRDLTEVVGELVELFPKAEVAESLDRMKDLGYEYSTRSGLTISIDDVRTPPAKAGLLEQFEGEAAKVEAQFERGIITDDERRQREIEIWTEATNKVTEAMQELLLEEQFNPIEMMVGSGARGNVMQVRQIAGMRGLVANPRGEIIPRPIKANFREGLTVLEYFISTHGARKGLADTALRTADSGYLTRRLVDVSQELIIIEIDCESNRGIWIEDVLGDPENRRLLDTPPARSLPRAGRHPRRRHGHPAQPRARRRRRRQDLGRRRQQPRAGPLGAHLRDDRRCVLALLRQDARDRQERRSRRGRRHRRRAVDR